MVGVHHDHDVAAHLFHRGSVTGLLVAAVAAIPLVNDRLDSKGLRDFDGSVARSVVDEQNVVDPFLRNVVVRRDEGLLCVVRREDDDDSLGPRGRGGSHKAAREGITAEVSRRG